MRVWVQAVLLQSEEFRRDLIQSLSVPLCRPVKVPLTSLMANVLVVSLNWNRTTCVVYGVDGA
jgi:hypothetical protein